MKDHHHKRDDFPSFPCEAYPPLQETPFTLLLRRTQHGLLLRNQQQQGLLLHHLRNQQQQGLLLHLQR